VPQTETAKAQKALASVLKEVGGEVTVDEKIAKLSVVGAGSARTAAWPPPLRCAGQGQHQP